ncbi:hypothetical protein DW836_09975 [Ruminococcus sp. AM34-9LB]|nr:hypothetical protein DW836_09975 [Ruminococcus sp. AM34-9LB]
MKKGRKVLRLVREYLRFEYGTVRVWLGIGIGLALFLIPLQQFTKFVRLRNEPVNLMEGFLYGILDPQQSMLVVLGYLFLISDAPFIYARTSQLIVRTSKRVWNSSGLFYILIQAAFYYLFLLSFSMFFLSRQGYLGDSWSIPLSQVARQEQVMLFQFQIYFPYWEFMKKYTVIQACFLAYLGNVLYAFVLGEILYVFNIKGRLSLGTWIAVFVHFSGYITRKEWKTELSLQAYASPAENGSFAPLLWLALLLCVFSYSYIRKIDYCVIEKEI